MRLVVADTSPLYYLFQIDHIDLLPQLFGTVFIPDAVHKELLHPSAPASIRKWAANLPTWIEVAPVEIRENDGLHTLGAGERAAITLVLSMHAGLMLIDERRGTQAAINRGIEVTGTLGILRLAAQRRLVDLADSFERLKRTSFRYPQKIMDQLLAEDRE